MIVIQNDVWRAECIAAMGRDPSRNTVTVLPINTAKTIDYYWETEPEAANAYINILTAWKRELEVTQ